MTVTVTVKTHAHEAVVTVNSGGTDEAVTVPARSTRDFYAHDNVSIGVAEGNAPAESPTGEGDLPLDPTNVPGRAENDKLLGASAADEPAKDAVTQTAVEDELRKDV